MKRLFKVGDKVKIRSDLVAGEIYGGLFMLSGRMSNELIGKIVKIKEISDGGNYRLDNGFIVTDEMIEGKDDIMVRMSDLKVGDKVRIVDSRTEFMNEEGLMDKYLGTVMTIVSFGHSMYGTYAVMKEDDGNWFWYEEMFDRHVSSLSLKVDMLVKLRNGDLRIVVNTADKGLVLFNPENGKCCEVKNYNEDYENVGSLGHNFDIMEIYDLPKTIGQGGILDLKCKDNRQLVYNRKKTVEMTLQQVNCMLIQNGLPPVKIIE